jgi:hypothetical protein
VISQTHRTTQQHPCRHAQPDRECGSLIMYPLLRCQPIKNHSYVRPLNETVSF